MLKSLSLFVDGGSRGNGTVNQSGYGSMLVSDGSRERREHWEFGDTTNNVAEYRALLSALLSILERVPDEKMIALSVFMDSMLVVNQVAGTWRVKDDELKPLCEQVRETSKRFGTFALGYQPRSLIVSKLGH